MCARAVCDMYSILHNTATGNSVRRDNSLPVVYPPTPTHVRLPRTALLHHALSCCNSTATWGWHDFLSVEGKLDSS